MLRSLDFFITCNPPKATHQASSAILKRRDGTQFIGKMSSSKGKKVRDNLMTLFSPFSPETPYVGPVRLRVEWIYTWNKTELKRNQVTGAKWCEKRPDCDNLIKMVKDVLEDLAFYANDSQVASETFSKWYRTEPGIYISLEEMDPLRSPEFERLTHKEDDNAHR